MHKRLELVNLLVIIGLSPGLCTRADQSKWDKRNGLLPRKKIALEAVLESSSRANIWGQLPTCDPCQPAHGIWSIS